MALGLGKKENELGNKMWKWISHKMDVVDLDNVVLGGHSLVKGCLDNPPTKNCGIPIRKTLLWESLFFPHAFFLHANSSHVPCDPSCLVS